MTDEQRAGDERAEALFAALFGYAPSWPENVVQVKAIKAALSAARADEREACAVLAETQARQRQGLDSYLDLRNLAAAIRARGQEGASSGRRATRTSCSRSAF